MKKHTKYKYVLIDLDDTLLDFKKAENFAFKKLLEFFEIEGYNKHLSIYQKVNHQLWTDFEKGKVKKEVLANLRFELTFKPLNPRLDFKLMNQVFMSFIAQASYQIEGSYELLKHLKSKYKIYIVSNGIKDLQLQRLNHSRIMDYVDGFVFSEETLKPKPHLTYFDYFFKKYNLKFNPDEYILIGDSISSDLQAANNLKIDSIWFNPNLTKTSFKPTYQVSSLVEIMSIL